MLSQVTICKSNAAKLWIVTDVQPSALQAHLHHVGLVENASICKFALLKKLELIS